MDIQPKLIQCCIRNAKMKTRVRDEDDTKNGSVKNYMIAPYIKGMSEKIETLGKSIALPQNRAQNHSKNRNEMNRWASH